jgi:hypothetical protein
VRTVVLEARPDYVLLNSGGDISITSAVSVPGSALYVQTNGVQSFFSGTSLLMQAVQQVSLLAGSNLIGVGSDMTSLLGTNSLQLVSPADVLVKAGNLASVFGANAVQLHQLGGTLREHALMARYQLLRRGVQGARTPVVAQSAPRLEHRLGVRLGQRLHTGKARHKALEMADDRLDARLLQHRLTDPDAVRIARATPRQIALHSAIPRQQGRLQCAQLDKARLHGSRW